MVDVGLIVGTNLIIVMTMVAMIVLYAARYKRVPPNHVMVLYGRAYPGGEGYHIWTRGGKFIVPMVESYKLLSLAPFHVSIEAEMPGTAGTTDRARVSATAKVSDDPAILEKAATALVDKPEAEVSRLAASAIEGQLQRLSLGALRSSDADLAESLRDTAETELNKIGLAIVSLSVSRAPGTTFRVEVGALDALRRELDTLDARLRRIEDWLGIPAVRPPTSP